MTSSPYLIGVSGKIGSGKNYFASSIIKELLAHGYVVKEAAFATPLKEEASHIIDAIRPHVREDDTTWRETIASLANQFDMSYEQMWDISSFVREELIANPELDGYSRSEGIRRGLQYLGTEVRRKKEENYWVDRFMNFVPKDADVVFVTDVRFPNEADCVLTNNGSLFRVEVPPEVIRKRTVDRDGLLYSEEALNHPSETSLDSYEHFTEKVGVKFDAESIAQDLIEQMKEK